MATQTVKVPQTTMNLKANFDDGEIQITIPQTQMNRLWQAYQRAHGLQRPSQGGGQAQGGKQGQSRTRTKPRSKARTAGQGQ